MVSVEKYEATSHQPQQLSVLQVSMLAELRMNGFTWRLWIFGCGKAKADCKGPALYIASNVFGADRIVCDQYDTLYSYLRGHPTTGARNAFFGPDELVRYAKWWRDNLESEKPKTTVHYKRKRAIVEIFTTDTTRHSSIETLRMLTGSAPRMLRM